MGPCPCFKSWSQIARAALALAVLCLAASLAAGPARAGEGGGPEPRTPVAGGGAGAGEKAAAAGVAWSELDPGLKEAHARKRPMLVDVYTDWCGWCRRMERDTYAAGEVRDYLAKSFVTVKLNAEDSKKTARYQGEDVSYRKFADGFRITGYPTTLFLDQDGELITALPGYVGAPKFIYILRFIGDGHYKTKSWDAYAQEVGFAKK